MAYREKLAWLTLCCMVVPYTVYFAAITAISRAGQPGTVQMIQWFAAVTLVQIIVIIIAAAVMAIRARREAMTAPDERDRMIAQRGTRIAYFVLMVGMILVGVVMPFSEPPWKIYNAALLTLVTAETVRYVVVVFSYRRGWHG